MFKQLHINISLADALILIPKYQKMLKSLLSNKEKLIELANTPLNENFSAVILKKLPEKLEDPWKFLILCSFSKLKCKALADLGASINLMPLSKSARDSFVLVGKFTFPADFVIVDYKSDHRVPLILGRPFLRTARALIDVHGEEMILCDGNERLILNMRHDTSSYSNEPHQESINMIDVYNVSHEEILKDLLQPNHPRWHSTSSLNSHYRFNLSKLMVISLIRRETLLRHLLNLDKIQYLPPFLDN
ncbi:reverse transcriptase domain-containing protein [Tanacetum coccineum]